MAVQERRATPADPPSADAGCALNMLVAIARAHSSTGRRIPRIGNRVNRVPILTAAPRLCAQVPCKYDRLATRGLRDESDQNDRTLRRQVTAYRADVLRPSARRDHGGLPG